MRKELDMHRVDDFNEFQCMRLHHDIQYYSKDIGGLIQNHKEVFSKRGFILPFLLAYDNLLWGRWKYWHEILEKKTIKGSGPIPQIKFSTFDDQRVQATFDMLRECLNHSEATIDNFASWLLWGFGQEVELNVSEDLNLHYYKKFDIFFLQDNPYDYFSFILEEYSSKSARKEMGYFSTPFDVVLLTNKLLNPTEEKGKSIYDNCIGCGALVLPASNYCFKAYGQDINQTALNLCLAQFLIYAPWFACHPKDIDLTE